MHHEVTPRGILHDKTNMRRRLETGKHVDKKRVAHRVGHLKYHIAFKFSRNILLSKVEFLKWFVLSAKPKCLLIILLISVKIYFGFTLKMFLIIDLNDLYFWVIHLEQKTFFMWWRNKKLSFSTPSMWHSWPFFGKSVNPILNRRCRLCPPHNYPPPHPSFWTVK